MCGSPNLTLNLILMVLVNLDVRIVSFHYFDSIQPSRGSMVRLLHDKSLHDYLLLSIGYRPMKMATAIVPTQAQG